MIVKVFIRKEIAGEYYVRPSTLDAQRASRVDEPPSGRRIHIHGTDTPATFSLRQRTGKHRDSEQELGTLTTQAQSAAILDLPDATVFINPGKALWLDDVAPGVFIRRERA